MWTPRTAQTKAVRELRREAFLDIAQRLIQANGYEQMTVQDVLDEVDASRGAFYHYFDSKVTLLDAVVQRTLVQGTEAVAPVVADPNLSAVEKLTQLFSGIASWKAERKELMWPSLKSGTRTTTHSCVTSSGRAWRPAWGRCWPRSSSRARPRASSRSTLPTTPPASSSGSCRVRKI